MRASRLAWALLVAATAAARGEPAPDRPALAALRAGGFAFEDAAGRERFALQAVGLLGSADPFLRDSIGFEGLQATLRSGTLSRETRAALLEAVSAHLEAPDPAGVARPFAILVLAELVRSDRVDPWLEPGQRAEIVATGTAYLEDLDDLRGFIDGEGWRHGVAHASDLLMQVAMNPGFDDPALPARLLEAVATKVAPPGHAYVHGEPGRLARPVLILARKGALDEAGWTAWLASVASPGPFGTWQDAFGSEAGLARLHDVKAFLGELHLNATASGDPAFAPLLAGLMPALRSLP